MTIRNLPPPTLNQTVFESADLRLTDDDHLFWRYCPATDLIGFVDNPVKFLEGRGVPDFRAHDCPDVTVVFSFREDPTLLTDQYLIEGTFKTNVLLVRPPRKARLLVTDEEFPLVQADSEVHIGRGPRATDLYLHYQLGGDLAAARKRIAGFVNNPHKLVDEINNLPQKVFSANGEEIVNPKVVVVLPNDPVRDPGGNLASASGNIGGAASLREVRFVYQWVNERATEEREGFLAENKVCSCNKARAVEVTQGEDTFAVVDTFIATTYIPCPPPPP
jgi:hypothetical protein